MDKYFYLIAIALYVMGTIGGIGYACYAHEYVIAVAVAALGAMAFPTAKKFYQKIIE